MTVNLPKLKLKLDAGSRGTVEIDGKDISHMVSAITVRASGGKMMEVELRVFGDIEAELTPEALAIETSGGDQS